jgi:hypothetical protein
METKNLSTILGNESKRTSAESISVRFGYPQMVQVRGIGFQLWGQSELGEKLAQVFGSWGTPLASVGGVLQRGRVRGGVYV